MAKKSTYSPIQKKRNDKAKVSAKIQKRRSKQLGRKN